MYPLCLLLYREGRYMYYHLNIKEFIDRNSESVLLKLLAILVLKFQAVFCSSCSLFTFRC